MTDKYAVIGNPVSHSKSPLIHAMFARQTGQDIAYEAILAPLQGFAETLAQLRSTGYCGCNITVPFKFEACKLATQLTERGKAAQAVNTLKLEDSWLLGDNTDGVGLVRDISRSLLLQGKRVLLLGAGGAAYGVILPLLQAGASLTVVNRTVEKSQKLQTAFDGKVDICSYPELPGKQFDCVINATSSGLSKEMPDLPVAIFDAGAMAYDLMYGTETPFMKFSRQHGATIVMDGLGMLVEQAAESFFLWRGVRPETTAIIKALRNPQ